jgi:hypothetical protein
MNCCVGAFGGLTAAHQSFSDLNACEDRKFADSPLEEAGFELVWGFSCQVVFSVYCQFFVRSGKAVLHPVACDQVPGARGRGQGTETLA